MVLEADSLKLRKDFRKPFVWKVVLNTFFRLKFPFSFSVYVNIVVSCPKLDPWCRWQLTNASVSRPVLIWQYPLASFHRSNRIPDFLELQFSSASGRVTFQIHYHLRFDINLLYKVSRQIVFWFGHILEEWEKPQVQLPCLELPWRTLVSTDFKVYN